MNILILAAGDGSRDETFPIWLSELGGGELVIQRQITALAQIGDDARFAFAFKTSDLRSFSVADIIRQLSPGASVIEVKRPTAGAACTALLMIGTVDMSDELIVASATDMVDVDYPTVIESFRSRGADAGVLTFESLHPRYSYVRVDEQDNVVEAAEKRPFSRHANAGFFWYRRAQDFFDSVRDMIIKDAHVNNIFYISPSLNELILKQKKIVRYAINAASYSPVKTDKQLDIFSSKSNSQRELRRTN